MPNKPSDNVSFYRSRVAQNRYACVILTAREVDCRPYAEAFIIIGDDDPIHGTRTFDWHSPPRDRGPSDEDATIETEIESARSSAENCLGRLRFGAANSGNAAQSPGTNDLVQDDNPAEAIKKLRRCGLPDDIIRDIRRETKSTALRTILDALPPLPIR